MIYLMDVYNQPSEDLRRSLATTYEDVTSVSVLYDGFLPEGVQSPYAHYLYGDKELMERPLYFNRLDVPEFWEIRSNGSQGEIYDGRTLRGRIFYHEPKHKRCIRVVDWLDEANKVRFSDHYDKFGHKYSRTHFDHEGKVIYRSYYNLDHQEVISENFVTHDIMVNQDGKTKIFKSRSDFTTDFIRNFADDQETIVINSLSTPFVVSRRFKNPTALFWQEAISNEVPGNMRVMLDEGHRVFVQTSTAYQRLLDLGLNENQIQKVGFVYPFTRDTSHRKAALTFTNSDQVEHIVSLAEQCPDVQFHIGAITEMSNKLMDLSRYKNVHLYPNVNRIKVRKLWEACDIYLDINHGNEILDSLRNAFLNNQLIFALKDTLHSAEYVDLDHIFDQGPALIQAMKDVVDTPSRWDEALEKQRVFALVETNATFQEKTQL